MRFLKISDIKCDNCSYTKNTGSWGETPKQIIKEARFWLTQNCPDCGAPLLTKKDFKVLRNIIRFVWVITPFQIVISWLRLNRLKTFNITTDGNGNPTIEEK